MIAFTTTPRARRLESVLLRSCTSGASVHLQPIDAAYGLDPRYPEGDKTDMPRPRARSGRRPELAEKMRAARAARGLTQHEAAVELHMAQSALAALESGTRKPRGIVEIALRAWCSECVSGRPVSLIRGKGARRA